jgi:hypothetical protein
MFRMAIVDNGVANCDVPLQKVEDNFQEQQIDIDTILIVVTRGAAGLDEFRAISGNQLSLRSCMQLVMMYTQQAGIQCLSGLGLLFRRNHIYIYQHINYYCTNKTVAQRTSSVLLFSQEADE